MSRWDAVRCPRFIFTTEPHFRYNLADDIVKAYIRKAEARSIERKIKSAQEAE